MPQGTIRIRNIEDKICYNAFAFKYQLSLIDSHDKIMLYTELDDLFDIKTTAVERRARRYCQLVDRRRPSLSRSERPPFSREVNSMFNDRYAVAKFSEV